MDKTFSFLQFVFKVCSLAFLWHQVINMGDMAYKGRPPARNGAPLGYFNNSMKIPQGEVVWCSGPHGSDSKRTDRFCNFRNLCYSNVYERFFLNRGRDLTFTNEAVERESRRISLTAAIGADMPFRYVDYPQYDVEIEQHIYRHYQRGKYFMMTHICANNIAHDIHDVLMPLFFSLNLSDSSHSEPSYTLILLFRDRLIGRAETIYRLFTQNEPILQLDFDEYLPDQSVVCFEDVTIGLSNSSVWYQWGLDGLHEGPLLDPKVTPEHFRKFKNYLIEKMNINIVCPQIPYGVLFTRKRTRQILNENELASSIEKEFEIRIQVVGMEDNSIMEIIRIVSCAELLISMHGALMILAMFLPRHAVVVEMYPYAINPEFYQVYRTMLNLQDLDIKYIAWRNMNASNAIEPPSYRFHLNNLSEEKRLAILGRTEAPRKVCCYDPEWRYRIYQNTVVNVTEVINLLKKHFI